MGRARALGVTAIIVFASTLVGAQPASASHLSISGTVTGSGGAPLSGVVVYAYVGGAGAACCTPVAGATTTSSGTYSIPLDAGTFRLRFYPGTAYVEEWHSNAPDFESAADVVVTSSNVIGIDAALTPGSKISGTLTAAGGGPLAGVGVHAFNTGVCCDWVTGTQTDASGNYSLTLANGTYKVLFWVSSGAQLSEWFDNAADFDTATALTVAGADLTGKNAELSMGQTITGTVTSSTSAPLADVFVGAFKNTTCCEWVAGAQTDASGNYTLAVANGTYRLMFYPTTGNSLMEWWNDAADFDLATPITVSGANVPGTNAQLASGRLISGTVTGSGPLENVFVGAFRATGLCCDWVSGAGTDSMGNYSIPVPDGTYRLMFYPSDGTHLMEWWNNATSFETAVDVVVSGADVAGKDADLASGKKISGTVTAAAGGAPIESVFVGAFDSASGAWVAGTGTDSAGKYAVTVPDGNYKLMFYPFTGSFLGEWWNDKADFTAANGFAVAGADVPGKDAALANGFVISGTVTAVTGGAALPGVGVIVFDATSGNWVTGTGTDAAGNYAVTVANGTYKVMFQPPPGYLMEFFNDKASLAAADTLTVNNADLPGKNAAIATGKVLSGMVTGASGALSGALVQLYQGGAASCAPPVFVDATQTDGLGKYSFTVASGDYRLAFVYANQLAEWHLNKEDCASSTSVTVGASDVAGVDAFLAAVTGTVTDANGPISGAQVQLQRSSVGCGDPPVTVGFAETASNGTYAAYVPDGSYRVVFFAAGHQSEFWNNVATCAAATVVPVAGANVPGKDAALTITYAVTGKVTKADGVTAVSGAQAVAFQGGSVVAGALTAADGTYQLDLPSGSYTVEFSKALTTCVTEWWNNKADSGTADTLVVGMAPVPNIDAALAGCP